jgi:hypothetical protein
VGHAAWRWGDEPEADSLSNEFARDPRPAEDAEFARALRLGRLAA